MIVGSLKLRLRLHASSSLKDRRSVVQSVKRKLRNKFNVAVVELDPSDDHRTAGIGVATVAGQRDHAVRELDHVVRFLDDDVRFEVVERELETF